MSCIVLLELQIKPESVNEMKAFLTRILPDTRTYAGCKSLDVYGDLENGASLVFHECWDSRAHYEKYFAWRTETGVAAQLGAMMAAAPVLRYCEKLDM
ncbi:MAG: antibiotic biosynthesis monooxygenase [Gammaproteobacteria bacterium]|nr:antibiotic biosynthesis monooxygenase [Gammaproteobacteria bacterium]